MSNEPVSMVNKKSMHASRVLNEPVDYAKPVPFSRGMRVDFGTTTLLFISGTSSVGADGQSMYPENFLAQCERTYLNLSALIESENCSWSDVVMTRCYLKDMRHYEQFSEFRKKFYEHRQINPLPASVCIQANLCRPELLVEVELLVMARS